jgi:hypothetical protein
MLYESVKVKAKEFKATLWSFFLEKRGKKPEAANGLTLN